MIYIWNSYELMGYLFYYALGIAMENGHLWFMSETWLYNYVSLREDTHFRVKDSQYSPS